MRQPSAVQLGETIPRLFAQTEDLDEIFRMPAIDESGRSPNALNPSCWFFPERARWRAGSNELSLRYPAPKFGSVFGRAVQILLNCRGVVHSN